MAYNPNNPNGQTTSANSAPVVISSNQSPSLLAQDDSIVLLSRMLKLLESLSTVDVAQRQRVVVDGFGTGVDLRTVAGMDREMYINQARVAYNTGTRTQLKFS